MSEDPEVSMRLKPSEVRIVNAVRGMKAGSLTVHKTETGQLDVSTRWHDPNVTIIKPAENGGAGRRAGHLRG